MKRKRNNRTWKKSTWTTHAANRYRRSIARKEGDFWAWQYGYGSFPAPGRLLAKSKVRAR
jgi:hypothetical protein